jgi:hypothetical protein
MSSRKSQTACDRLKAPNDPGEPLSASVSKQAPTAAAQQRYLGYGQDKAEKSITT